MRISAESQSLNISKAAGILKAGGVVIFPTDTVYGIGCAADNQKALDRIYKIKGTPKTQLFPILVSEISQVPKLPPAALTLVKKHWPGALTVILKSGGFRMPNSKLVKSLIQKAGKPIVGTSANFHGHPAPKSYSQLDPNLVKLADFVIKGECKLGIESTVVDATVDPPKVIRLGAVKL